ncbi:hypothetical protein TSAR_005587 [Trichomalopsis sarcophagae]|uniref:Uncharacterized protein n=1 Tax=Trichomalopsis sarcophagae TaxID=543379 RepID=A0A232F2K6_9HYME|nr:hypothetical protein TSAR_005587 [Trichomalopsis sarcophagae]
MMNSGSGIFRDAITKVYSDAVITGKDLGVFLLSVKLCRTGGQSR